EIGLRSTRIRTGDGNMLIVPNSELVNTRILNLSMPSREMICSSSFRVPYTVSFARVKAIALATVDEVSHASGRGKWVNLAGLAQGYQTVTAGFWIREMNDAGAAVSLFNERLLERLQAEKIELVPATLPV
ncbi:MAG: mechanosensitive ion channel domain-containing protein, partial [Bdellovibrionota bacterium]